MARALVACVVLALAGAIGVSARQSAWPVPRGIHEPLNAPAANLLTANKVALGRRLFSSKMLSRTSEVSCATCHDPARAFSDARTLAVGVAGRTGTRHSPALINRGFGESFFWDGRASSLEAQVVMPIADPNEMDFTVAGAVTRLQRDPSYAKEFSAAFGRPVNARDLGYALASFVRSIVSGDSRVDRYLDGDDAALSATEARGMRVFRGAGLCTTCHKGGNFTDESFHNTGIAWAGRPGGAGGAGGEFLDEGRAAITGKPDDGGAFKTPTLREVTRTAPYMHDGSLPTLEAVVDYYDRGGNVNPLLDPEIRPLRLSTEEKRALVSFLASLSGEMRP